MYSEMLAEANLVSIQRDWDAGRWSRAWRKARKNKTLANGPALGASTPGQTQAVPPSGGAFAQGR
jgi:hypothetical protein